MKRKPTFLLVLVLAAFFYFPSYGQSNTPGVRIVMLGDSITARGNWLSLLKPNVIMNRGVNGDRTSDVRARIGEIYKLKPKWCFVMIGINDILSGQPIDRICDNYQKIIDDLIKREIGPIIQSTLYLAGPDPKNELVEILNRTIKKMAEERKILYLDLNRTLAPDKQLLAAFTNDGLHLNQAGYQAWRVELLKTSAVLFK
ncbi:MAG: lipolytic protein [Desulfobacca sp.]|nr:lipolytic protein [Desulfobacca sp.]